MLRWESVLEDTRRQTEGESLETRIWVEGLFHEYHCGWNLERVEGGIDVATLGMTSEVPR